MQDVTESIGWMNCFLNYQSSPKFSFGKLSFSQVLASSTSSVSENQAVGQFSILEESVSSVRRSALVVLHCSSFPGCSGDVEYTGQMQEGCGLTDLVHF